MTHKDEKRECSIVRLDENRLKDLEILYKAVYRQKLSKNYLLKKYDTAYTGTQYIGHIAYDKENAPIACFGVIPCFIQYKDQIILSAQAADAMTLPRYRYKGLFVELAKKTFDLCRATGIKLLFGFPNQNSHHGLVHKLGWRMTEFMERFVIPVNSFPLESFSQHFSWTRWIYKKYLQIILPKYSLTGISISNPVIDEGFGGIYRDTRYLKYKTYGDTQMVKIGNAKVWIKIHNGLVIGDAEIADRDFDAVVDSIKKMAKRSGVANIFFQVSPGVRLHTLFAKKYKPLPSFSVIFLDLGAGIPLDKIKFSCADIDIF